MSRTVDTGRERGTKEGEVTRYRRAAEETLDQLEWCINALYRLGKPRIADAVAANHRSIRRRMREPGSRRALAVGDVNGEVEHREGAPEQGERADEVDLGIAERAGGHPEA